MKVSDRGRGCGGWIISIMEEMVKMKSGFVVGYIFFKIIKDGRIKFGERSVMVYCPLKEEE